jgi:hypothetical protein
MMTADSQTQQAESTAIDFTEQTKNPTNTVVCKSGSLYNSGHQVRAHILLRMLDLPQPTYEELAKELGLANRQAVAHHVAMLKNSHLMTSWGAVTATGRQLLDYIEACTAGEVCWRRLVRQHCGAYTRAWVARLVARAWVARLVAWGQRMDNAYALTRQGLRRRAGAGKELERKVSWSDIIAALKRTTTIVSAANAVGIKPGALHQRIQTLFARVVGGTA